MQSLSEKSTSRPGMGRLLAGPALILATGGGLVAGWYLLEAEEVDSLAEPGPTTTPVKARSSRSEAKEPTAPVHITTPDNPTPYEMVPIPVSTGPLGCTKGQSSCDKDERRRLDAPDYPFRMGRSEVTQGLWVEVMGTDPTAPSTPGCHPYGEHARGPDLPVYCITWVEALEFANLLSVRDRLEPCYDLSGEAQLWPEGLDCTGYRLPTEAEWEVAARGGQDSLYSGGNNIDALGWTEVNSGGELHPVCQKTANFYGLHDMSGNVWEWVWEADGSTVRRYEVFGHEYSRSGNRIIRGGAWSAAPRLARVSNRSVFPALARGFNVGLRLARTPP